MSSIENLSKFGQSVWYDNIERRLIENGDLEKMILDGDIQGVTSNPSIFQKAISKSRDYDAALKPMAWANWKAEDIFFQLAIEDIQATADLFNNLYLETNGLDGYVSLEVSPYLAYETEKTFEQVEAIWKRVGRKNLMVKIPATKEGLPAIRRAIASGYNINVTLIFSVERYSEVIEAYLSGLEDRVDAGLPIDHIASVASFFVSRVDNKVDPEIEKLVTEGELSADEAMSLSGKAAIANSKMAYALFEEKFSGERFKKLADRGAKFQRPLWASTSTKNPAYSDVLYVEELIGPNTVNTMPPHTLEAFKDHGSAAGTLKQGLKEAEELLTRLDQLGISMDDVTGALEKEGVKAFADSFRDLLDTIEKTKSSMQMAIGKLAEPVAETFSVVERDQIVTRMFEKDATIWSQAEEEHNEIRHRLGWLDAPYTAEPIIEEANLLRDQLIDEGFTHALLLGMGGSSLASEVLSNSFAGRVDGLELSILDSTDPRQVIAATSQSPIENTLFIVASKSGTTSEVQAFLAYLYELVKSKKGTDAGKQFIAITDPGTQLVDQAETLGFRSVFLSDPNAGGRYSALTAFGLVPAAIMGVDLTLFIERAAQFANECRPGVPEGRNPGLALGILMAEAFKAGKDKLTIVAEEPFRSFGSWLEQLIAESSGKAGKGIIPIDIEPFVHGDVYSNDRFFVYLQNDQLFEDEMLKKQVDGHPVIRFRLTNPYNLGAEFFRWEYATAVACSLMNVNAFNQADVQDNKNRTKQKLNHFQETGNLNEDDANWSSSEAALFWSGALDLGEVNSVKDALEKTLEKTNPGDYVAINAYLPRNEKMLTELQALRAKVLAKTGCATTLGFGPRFLHSTGQLHKGGPDCAVIIQITDEPGIDLVVPGKGFRFDVLERAQALGDYEALVARDRRVLRIHLKNAQVSDLLPKM